MQPLGEGPSRVSRITSLFRQYPDKDSVDSTFCVHEFSAEAVRPAIYGAKEIGYMVEQPNHSRACEGSVDHAGRLGIK